MANEWLSNCPRSRGLGPQDLRVRVRPPFPAASLLTRFGSLQAAQKFPARRDGKRHGKSPKPLMKPIFSIIDSTDFDFGFDFFPAYCILAGKEANSAPRFGSALCRGPRGLPVDGGDERFEAYSPDDLFEGAVVAV